MEGIYSCTNDVSLILFGSTEAYRLHLLEQGNWMAKEGFSVCSQSFFSFVLLLIAFVPLCYGVDIRHKRIRYFSCYNILAPILNTLNFV